MTAELQQNRYDQLIRRVGGLIGPGSKVSEALGELFPVLEVEPEIGELLLLMGTRMCMGGGFLAQTAGQSPTAQLFNPADSAHLVTITSVRTSATSAHTIRYGLGQTALGTAVSTQLFRDTRLLLPALPIGTIRQRIAVAQANATNQSRVSAESPFLLQDPNGVAVLAPGTGFEIGIGTTNIAMNFGFTWRERVAEPSELNL